MAFGDAWGSDGKTYDGKEMRQNVYALTGGAVGVIGPASALAVSAQTSPTNTVKLAAGGAIIAASGAGESYQVANDADLNSGTIAPTSTNPRIDLVIVRVTNGTPAAEIVQGVAAPSPVEPSVAGSQYLVLARLDIPASTTNITNAMITDRRGRLAVATIICTSTTRPASPFAGLRIYETDTGFEYVFSGSGWIHVSGIGAWQAASFFAPWQNFGGGWPACGYRLEPGGIVRLKGLAALGALGTAIFQLPVGFRPAANQLVAAAESSNIAYRLEIQTNGNVVHVNGTSNPVVYVSLNGITFPLTN